MVTVVVVIIHDAVEASVEAPVLGLAHRILHGDHMVECCFASTETVGLLGTGAQDGHLDFHTAPEL